MSEISFLREHGSEREAIWPATGLLVSIVSIFTSLLNIFGGD
jgi:FtsH-binding integral membrane protein